MITHSITEFWSCLLILCILACSPTKGQSDLSTEQVQSDLRQLQSELERYHPGYDWYTSRDSLTQQFDEAINNAQATNTIAFFGTVRRLVAQVRCGHTRASMPESERQAFEATAHFMPVSVVFSEKGAYIKAGAPNTSGLEVGDHLVAINDRPVSEIVKTIFNHLSADGFNETLKYQLTARNFSYLFSLFVDDKSDRYQLDVMRNDVHSSVEVAGVSIHEWLDINSRTRPDGILELTDHQDYYYLRISSFGGAAINQSSMDYYDFLSSSFEEIAKSSKPLILDLRGNGGGDDLYGAKLVSYLVDRPFRYFDKIEVTEHYSGYGTVREAGGSRLMTSHDGLNMQQPDDSSFDGPLFVLIDGLCFSTCGDVASVLKANNRVAFIGEETGGGSGGNTSGYSRTLTLDHSGISINIPMWKYSTAPDPDRVFGRGVLADVEIASKIDEILSETDKALEVTTGLIRQN